jgi:hypothetical protein
MINFQDDQNERDAVPEPEQNLFELEYDGAETLNRLKPLLEGYGILLLNMTPQIEENLFEIAAENAEELYDQYGAEGLWVTEDHLPSDPSEFTDLEYQAVLAPERVANVIDGDSVTETEFKALRQHRLETIIYGGDCDADTTPAYCLAEVRDADGNDGIALILCNGYSFSVLKIWVHGIFETREAAKAHMKENGWLS